MYEKDILMVNREKKAVSEIAFTNFLNLLESGFQLIMGQTFRSIWASVFQRLGCLNVFKNAVILHRQSNAPQKAHYMGEEQRWLYAL